MKESIRYLGPFKIDIFAYFRSNSKTKIQIPIEYKLNSLLDVYDESLR